MGFEEEFSDLMLQSVSIRAHMGRDLHGNPQYADPVVYRARVEGRVRRIMSTQGEERVSTTTIVLLNSTGIDPRSEVTLPEGFTPQKPPILAKSRVIDDLGRITEMLYT